MNSTLPVATHSATLSRSPRNMLSNRRTLSPRSSSMGMTWEPMNPAPPVMKTVDMEVLLGRSGGRGSGSASGGNDLAHGRSHPLDLRLGEVGVHGDGQVPAEEVRRDGAGVRRAVDRLQVGGVGAEVALHAAAAQLGGDDAAVDAGVEGQRVALPRVGAVRTGHRELHEVEVAEQLLVGVGDTLAGLHQGVEPVELG